VAAGQQRHLAGLHRQRLDQLLHQACQGQAVAVFKGAHVVGRGDIDDLGVGQLGVALAGGDQKALHIVALGFGQAR